MSAPAHIARENGKKGGRPPGKKTERIIQRDAVLKAYRDRIAGLANDLLNSQLTLARGQTYLYKIEKEILKDKKGNVIKIQRKKPQLVTNTTEIEDFLENKIENGEYEDPEATYYFLTTKDPDGQTITALLDRTFGKPTQSVDVTSDGEKITLNDEQLRLIARRVFDGPKSG